MRWLTVTTLGVVLGCTHGRPSAGVGVGAGARPCPLVLAPTDTYPRTSYVSYVLNGRLIAANLRAIHHHAHSAVLLDSAPALAQLNRIPPGEIAALKMLQEEEAAAHGFCPGTRALLVETK